MGNRRRVWLLAGAGLLVVAALVWLCFALAAADERAKLRCAQTGGHVKTWTTQGIECITHNTGTSSWTSCFPVTYTHWRCDRG